MICFMRDKRFKINLKAPRKPCQSTKFPDNSSIKCRREISMAPSLLSSNMQNGVLPLIDETLQLLSQKHPEEKTPSNNILLPDTTVQVHPIRFEEINSESIRQSELRSKGGAGPSGLDSDGWRRLLTSSAFGEEPSDLCSAMPSSQEHCVLTSNTTTRSSPRLRRLIPLNMNPGLRPIRVDETLRRIIGKAVAKVLTVSYTHLTLPTILLV